MIRTEMELEDGTEYEMQGIKGPIHFQSVYFRIRVGKRVFIFDLRCFRKICYFE